MTTVSEIARVAHEANRAYVAGSVADVATAIARGDEEYLLWDEVSDEQRQSVCNGVVYVMDNPELSAEDLHAEWMDYKQSEGWTWGPRISEEHRTHPNMVPFYELDPEEQRKDRLFIAIVLAMVSE